MAAASQCIFTACEMLVSKQATACDVAPLSKKHCGTPVTSSFTSLGNLL